MEFSSPPQTIEEFQARVGEVSPTLPKRLLQCAEYLSTNTDRIALSTVADLSAAAGVAPSAIMRFCQAIGFGGFSDMQRLFRTAMSQQLPDYSVRLQNLRDVGAGSPSALLAEFVEAGSKSLEKLASTVDSVDLDNAVEQLGAAQTIHVIGMRRAFPVASYMAYAFEKMEIPCVWHGATGKLGFAHALRPGDAVIAVTFAPYSAETLEFAQAARECDLPVVMITDKRGGLLRGQDFLPILVSEVDFGAFRSLSATLTVAISLAVAIGARRRSEME